MQGLEASARGAGRVDLPTAVKSKSDERALAQGMRMRSEFVDNVLATGTSTSGKPVVTSAMLEAAHGQSLPVDFEVDTGTMHPANMVGTYHAWRIKSSYPIPGKMVNDDYRRRFLAMYASQQDKALGPSRRQREAEAEVAVAVTERYEEHRLPNAMEALLGKIEGVLVEKDRAIEEVSRATRVYEGTEEQVAFFQLLRQRKVRHVEDLFARGEVNVAVVEPGTSATGLLRAVSLGMLTIVRLFCKGGADVDYANPRGVAALHCAWDAWLKVKTGHASKRMRYLITRDIINILLEYGADVNKATSTGLTALHMASTFGHDDTVALLLRFGADRGRRDKLGRTALDIARANKHPECAGLLANWGAIEKAMKFEEFRKEWSSALETRISSERKYNGRNDTGTGAQDKSEAAKTSFMAAFADEPMQAGALALRQGRNAMMRAAGAAGADAVSSKSAEALIEALRLQEHLRERRKAAAAEDVTANTFRDPTIALQVAEYDMTNDSLRAIDVAGDLEGVGDLEGANRLRLGGAGGERSKLPWGKRAATVQAGGMEDNEVDELSRAISEEEYREAQVEGRADAREAAALHASGGGSKSLGGPGLAGSTDSVGKDGSSDDVDGVAVRAVEGGGVYNSLIRGDSTRDITRGLYGEGGVAGLGAGGTAAARSISPIRVVDPGEEAAQKARAALLSASGSSRSIFSSTRQLGAWVNPTGAGGDTSTAPGQSKRRRAKAGKKKAGGSGGGDGGSVGSVASDDEEGKSRNVGPPADTTALQAAMDATTRKAQGKAWRNEMRKHERDRGKAERSVIRSLVLSHGKVTSAAEGGGAPGRPPPGADALNLGMRETDGAPADSESEGDGGAGGAPRGGARRSSVRSVDSNGVLMSDRLKEVLGEEGDEEFFGLTGEELKAKRFRKKMIKYYYGQEKAARTDGSELAARRKLVATGLSNDAPELLPEYTRLYEHVVVTRRPAITSTLLRPSRFRVDTRTTVDAEAVVAKGQAFETMMAGAVTTQAEMDAALGVRKKTVSALADPEDKPGPPRGGMDARSLSLHGAASLHDPVEVAEVALVMAGEEGDERRRLLAQWAPPQAQPIGFGNRAVNSAALLPATSLKRPDAEARDKGVRPGGREGGGQPTHAQELAHDREARTRKLLVEAKAGLAAEAQHAALLAIALDEGGPQGAASGASGRAKVLELRAEEKRKDEVRKRVDKLPSADSYGQGLISSWPLHKAGPLVLEPGQSLLGMSTLSVLAQSKAEFEEKTGRNTSVFAKYAEIKAQKAAVASARQDALIGAASGGAALTLAASPSAPLRGFKPKFKPHSTQPKAPATEAEKAESAKRAVEKLAVPSLTPAGAESLSFLSRPRPDRPLWDPNDEADTRAGRDPHYAVFKGTQDPWAKKKFSFKEPTDRIDM